MKSVIYTIIGLIIIVIAAFLVSPYFVGSKTHEGFSQLVAKINKEYPYVTVTLEDYQRHWFSSTAKVKVNLHLPKYIDPKQEVSKDITFDAVIKHGPIYLFGKNHSSDVKVGLGAFIITGSSPTFQGKIIGELGFNQKIDLFANIPLIAIQDQSDKATFEFHNTKLDTKEAANSNTMYTLTVNKITGKPNNANMDNGMATLNNLKLTTTGHLSGHFWLGKSALTADSIVATLKESGKDVTVANVKDISANTSSANENGALNMHISINVASADVMGKTIKPITLSYGINGLDFKGLNQISGVISAIISAVISAAISASLSWSLCLPSY